MTEKRFTHAGRRVSIRATRRGENRWDWAGDVDGKPFTNMGELAPYESTALEEAAAEARQRIKQGVI